MIDLIKSWNKAKCEVDLSVSLDNDTIDPSIPVLYINLKYEHRKEDSKVNRLKAITNIRSIIQRLESVLKVLETVEPYH